MTELLVPWRAAAQRMGRLAVLWVLPLVTSGLCADAVAQSTPVPVERLRQEIDALRTAQDAMRAELQELKAQLQKLSATAPSPAAAAPAAGAELSLRDAQIKGAQDAKVTLVEFSDFQCPFCARHATSTYPEILRDYVQTGRVRYAFMNSPIESLHPAAYKQHLAAACAADQGRFWEMHDRLFANAGATTVEALANQAAAVGLDLTTFRVCMETDRHGKAIRESIALGQSIGVSGTPTFLIGVVGPDDKFRTVRTIAGARPYAAFKEALDGVLMDTARPAPSRAVTDRPSVPWQAGEAGWRAADSRH